MSVYVVRVSSMVAVLVVTLDLTVKAVLVDGLDGLVNGVLQLALA